MVISGMPRSAAACVIVGINKKIPPYGVMNPVVMGKLYAVDAKVMSALEPPSSKNIFA
jgi:hypothetical protein